MKRYLLTGLLLALPLAALLNHATPANAMQQPKYSITDQWHQKFLNDIQRFQNLFTHTTNPQQMQQQFGQMVNELNQLNQQMMIDQAVIHRSGVRKLPRQSTSGRAQQNITSGLKLTAGDNTVSQNTLQTAAQIIQDISLPTLQQQLNQKPSAGTEIALFSSQRSYGQALLQAGVPRDQINAIVTNTGGITIGNAIWIPLYNLKDQTDLANVLTHELTHVIFNQQGIGESLPTWINEGMAWHVGLLGQQQLDPTSVQNQINHQNQSIAQVARSGQLLPLEASEDNILTAGYNVEWVDYLAVNQLLQTYGEDQFRAFLVDIPRYGVETSFQQHFGESITDFEDNFTI
ncbi:hypothetical protein [Tumebacillus permanentifrigoris]|uniref:Peptidase MA superfamily protein n=1 Tax=Tumebacillus permanentifrigoris TaxID=378543 RepID=A0A316D2B1_9BACL|nr:hypothetical protein [Tumebacillus permanentifrigoris]PWK03344.1 hypothetical protein C7459_1482 [Tumebacillus permanentifrigoris]